MTSNEFQTLPAENRKARDPKDRLWRGTESWWELDERRDLVSSWCCKRSERYSGRHVCKAVKVKVASLNCIYHYYYYYYRRPDVLYNIYVYLPQHVAYWCGDIYTSTRRHWRLNNRCEEITSEHLVLFSVVNLLQKCLQCCPTQTGCWQQLYKQKI